MRKVLFKLPSNIPRRCFGGGHHEHHHEAVKYATSSPYISTKDTTKDMVAIFGFEDLNDHHHEDDSDPYVHCRGKPLLSFERMVIYIP